jgi:abortive infection bacteriophage resistance protein
MVEYKKPWLSIDQQINNYVRNVAAHHARLYNRKLVAAPRRPKVGTVPLLDHLRQGTTSKDIFGTYNALAVIAYFLRTIDSDSGWTERIRELIATFPATPTFSIRTLGFPVAWESLELWHGR